MAAPRPGSGAAAQHSTAQHSAVHFPTGALTVVARCVAVATSRLCAISWELKAGGEKSSGKKGSSSSSSAGAGPSARSGHRMVLYKHKILVFGGFYDSGFETKYFGDLHAFDLEQMAWLPAIVPT